MALAPFFKLFKNKSFNYTPRYYDERKEELAKRIAQIKKEMGVTDDSEESKVTEKAYSIDIRGKMRNRFRPLRRSENRKSNIRLLVIFLILSAISYYVFFH